MRWLLLLCSKVVPIKKWRKAVRTLAKIKDPALSFSQEGEDLILNKIFEKQKTGFYVDVGAHHPFRFSNTALFSKKGWLGINIDPLPRTKRLFDKYRPRDINLELGVASCSGKLTYHMFGEPALNTFDKQLADLRVENGWRLNGKKDVSVFPLSEILETYLPDNRAIDFITIDVEGLDLDVIRSNDWEKYAPRVVVIEALDCRTVNETLSSPLVFFLKQYGYEVVAKTQNSVFLENNHAGL